MTTGAYRWAIGHRVPRAPGDREGTGHLWGLQAGTQSQHAAPAGALQPSCTRTRSPHSRPASSHPPSTSHARSSSPVLQAGTHALAHTRAPNTHVHTHIHMCTRSHAPPHRCTYSQVHTHSRMHTLTLTCAHSQVYSHICTHRCTPTHSAPTHNHMCTHTHIQVYPHKCTWLCAHSSLLWAALPATWARSAWCVSLQGMGRSGPPALLGEVP